MTLSFHELPAVSLGADDLDACEDLLAVRLPRWTRPRLEEDLGRPDRHWRGVWRDQELVGLTGVWDAPDVSHLLAVAVAERLEGQGLGALLLDDAMRGARARGARGMTLEVRPGNRRAIALYESRGFVEVGTRPRYFNDEDAILMSVVLATAGAA